MSKFNDFYAKVSDDAALKAEVDAALGGSAFENASDEQLMKLGDIAKKAGFDFSIDEAKEFFSCGELDEEDLDSVAGGKGKENVIDEYIYVCNVGGQAGVDDNNFGDDAQPVRRWN